MSEDMLTVAEPLEGDAQGTEETSAQELAEGLTQSDGQEEAQNDGGGADVASLIVLGKYAYGITSLKGSKPSVIVKPAGSAGTADPLDQISTVGWKMDGFGVKMLQPEYAVRIECGFSA